jgi:hypothetical protein
MQEVTIRCQDCEWEFSGLGGEARAEWNEHRFSEHDDFQQPPKADERSEREIRERGETLSDPERPGASGSPPSVEEPKREAQGRRPRGYWTPERIIEAFRSFHAEHGRPPRQHELRAPLLPASVIVQRHFGGLAKLAEAAGLAGSAPLPAPKPKGQPKETPAAPVAPAPAPAEASQVTGEGTLGGRALRLAEVVGAIWATREQLLNLQGEALVLLEELREEIEA